MSKSRVRLQVVVLAFILLPATAGIVAVHASAACERFVRTYVTKPVRNIVSKQTADAWAKWGIAHPDRKPNPNIHRPKYVMTREEAVQKVDFACSVPLIPTDAEWALAPNDGPPPIVNLHNMGSTELDFPPLTPPEVAENTPPVLVLPLVPPDYPLQTSGAIPEPASLIMVGTGFGFLCLLLAAKDRKLLWEQ